MRARCYRCQHTFETDRFGVQKCPSCQQEVLLPDPNVPPQGSADAPPPPMPPPGAGGPGWGVPAPGWTAPAAETGPAASAPPQEQSAPFAERARRGFFPAFVETWKLAAMEPARFFRQVRTSESTSAVLFGVICCSIGTWVSLLVRYFTVGATANAIARFAERLGDGAEMGPFLQAMQKMNAASLAGAILFTPFFTAVALYVVALVFHVLLLMVRGTSRGFDATLTVVGYGFGIFLLEALPVCGGLVAAVWFAVAAILGLSEAQRCGSGKAAFAVLAPLLGICLCACLAGALGAAGLAGLHGGGGTPPPSIGL